MAELREFQNAAVEKIVSRLTDRQGSRRFLLADEVGLGKTLVAKGVIDGLRSRSGRRGFTIVYICSNAEIADQNRDKLCENRDSAVPGRLTLLSLQSQEIVKRRDDGRLQVFAFTPGTSLQVENGTGIARERRLLLYLLLRIWRKRVNRTKWREFLRCSAGEERWFRDTRFRCLKDEFFRRIAGDLQARLKVQWDSQQVQLLDLETGKEESKPRWLSVCIDQCVDQFAKTRTDAARKNRDRIVGELRKGLARVALEFLEPQLVILDEFQRFSDILIESRDSQSIVGKLFARGSSAILILSATPYKMYTLAHENEDHHQDFVKTLAFLRNEAVEGPSVAAIQADLRAFRERLTCGEWATAGDPELFALRERIEGQLKEVMCRTERNWYLDDAAKGVAEVEPQGVLPAKAELVEYVHLRHFLLRHKVGDWNITDFWKSSPSVLSFMDSQYGLTSRLRRERMALPEPVLRPTVDLPDLATDNAKVRQLFDKVFACAEGGDGHAWKYLWLRPTYTYYQDTFYTGPEPTKFLVFSHWRFVPKAVSVMTSQEAQRRIGRFRRRFQSSPLQFRERIAFYPFDVCYPSLALARCVDQVQLRRNLGQEPTDKQLLAAARKQVEAMLVAAGVRIGTTRTAPLWKIMARVESRSEHASQIKTSWVQASSWEAEDTSKYLPEHADLYLEWMDDDSPLTISPVWVNRLALIALYSPAVSLLRAFRSVYPAHPPEVWSNVLDFCLGSLRHYFNKRMVQTIIRRHGSGETYTEKILSYCRQAHFQAVIDEYAYLVRHVLQQDDSQDWRKWNQEKQFPKSRFLSHVGRSMGMWAGTPGVNERTRAGHISARPKPQPAHFALAFGDDVFDESAEADGKTRKSAVREAFNSPFWPFVLATTSVGQEGLDFHLYCRDIVHWNLPSNPVDLEQREGRINRYDGLSIRRNIGRDIPLDGADMPTGGNVWTAAFTRLAANTQGNGLFKHGLFPHWIYQGTDGRSRQSIVRRHLLFYAGSQDRQHYADLKNALALYRLAFGQPRQQDILEQLTTRYPNMDSHTLGSLLSRYMINLSPLPREEAIFPNGNQRSTGIVGSSQSNENSRHGEPRSESHPSQESPRQETRLKGQHELASGRDQ